MADFQVEFDSDTETTKQTLTKLISDIGELRWTGDAGTFAGSGFASGVKGDVSVAPQGDGSLVHFGYSLPFKLKMLGGKVDSEIRKALEKKGGRVV